MYAGRRAGRCGHSTSDYDGSGEEGGSDQGRSTQTRLAQRLQRFYKKITSLFVKKLQIYASLTPSNTHILGSSVTHICSSDSEGHKF